MGAAKTSDWNSFSIQREHVIPNGAMRKSEGRQDRARALQIEEQLDGVFSPPKTFGVGGNQGLPLFEFR